MQQVFNEVFILEDTGGDNTVTGVEKIGDSYKILGKNNPGKDKISEERYIIVHQNGSVTGYNGLKLGNVEKLMAKNASKILMHFGIFVEIPKILSNRQISSYKSDLELQSQHPKKFIVINGHGSKSDKKVRHRCGTILPQVEWQNYTVAFDDKNKHLEESIVNNRIMPIESNGVKTKWLRYNNNVSIHDINIEPLKEDFTIKKFYSVLNEEKTEWENIGNKAHNVIAGGVLVVMTNKRELKVFEGEEIKSYINNFDNTDIPLFFCDTVIGKLKPLSNISLSQISNIIPQINKLKDFDLDFIVATCSTSYGNSSRVTVKTSEEQIEIMQGAFHEVYSQHTAVNIHENDKRFANLGSAHSANKVQKEKIEPTSLNSASPIIIKNITEEEIVINIEKLADQSVDNVEVEDQFGNKSIKTDEHLAKKPELKIPIEDSKVDVPPQDQHVDLGSVKPQVEDNGQLESNLINYKGKPNNKDKNISGYKVKTDTTLNEKPEINNGDKNIKTGLNEKDILSSIIGAAVGLMLGAVINKMYKFSGATALSRLATPKAIVCSMTIVGALLGVAISVAVREMNSNKSNTLG